MGLRRAFPGVARAAHPRPVPVEIGGGDERTEEALWPNGTVVAVSASLTDVQAAYDSASSGQRILIPNGTVTWTGALNTAANKQVLIRAQNYTPTPGGSSSQSVVITNNASGNLIVLQSGSTYHVGLAGIRFNEGTGGGNYLRLTGSGSKVALISDIYMELDSRSGGTSQDICQFAVLSQGGVIWNSQFVSTDPDNGGGACLVIKPTSPAWDTASTMGDADTDGAVNLYMEDSYVGNMGTFPDADHAARWVARYSEFDGVWGTSHGPSSGFGGRHVEYYHNTHSVTNVNRNHSGRYYWLRGGTGVFWSEVHNTPASTVEYGNVTALVMGEEGEIPGPYPDYEGPGFGHDGVDLVSDPIYSWDNTGGRAYTSGVQADWTSHCVAERDFFPPNGGPNPGAKPGYAPFEYPHTMRYEPA